MSNAIALHSSWRSTDTTAQAQFFAEGMRCVRCADSLRHGIGDLAGVKRVDVNLATARVNVEWQPSRLDLQAVLDRVMQLGFRAVPLMGEAAGEARRIERRRSLKRIGLAGLGAMQMSMYTVGLYAGERTGIDHDMELLLRVTSLLITVPILFYSGAPFLRGAWRDLRSRVLGMDVPVAAALLLAFGASVVNTLLDRGQVYFDSVAMFIFFLLIGRHMEVAMRRSSLDASEALARTLPASVTRMRAGGGSERVAPREIRAGDALLIGAGGVLPVDATLRSDTASVDEALITGEAMPVNRMAGDALRGGSVNIGAPIEVVAQTDLGHSTIASMIGLIERSQGERPRTALAADRAARWFVMSILLLSAVVAALWWWVDRSRAFDAVLAVLVVTCPCALSLATPAAIAAATTRLARRGLLVTRANALERLAQVDTVMLDKTGTLTGNRLLLGAVHCHSSLNQAQCLDIAAALERGSTHPAAAGFADRDASSLQVGEVRETAGQGVGGIIDGVRWRIGQWSFVAALARASVTDAHTDERLWLGNGRGMAASFELQDALRPEAAAAVEQLRSLGLDLVIASGDRAGAVQRVASALGIARASARMSPDDKQTLVGQLQRQGQRVLMLGDGINDAPVLATAHVSCAMGQGTAIAQSAADLLLMNESLLTLADAVRVAREHLRLVRGNLRWALGYNLLAVPLAALGYVPPWLAAVGMSASSLWVVWRAHRFAGGGK